MPLTLVSTAPASTVAIGGGISGTTTGGGAASPISVFNAATLGAKIDGTAMDTTIAGIINNQIAGAKGTLYFPPGNYGLGASLIIPSNVRLWMAKGARFTATAAGVTLTINGDVDFPADQIFDNSVNTFAVSLGVGRMWDVRPEWWGAIADNPGTENGPAFTAATTALGTLALAGALRLSFGDYKISSQIVLPPMMQVVGAGMRSSRITSSVAGVPILLGTTGGALAYGNRLSGFSLILTNTNALGVQAQGTAGLKVSDFYMEGVVGGLNGGIFIDGDAASNLFTTFSNVILNHVKVGLHMGTSGAVNMTSLRAHGLSVFCDSQAGSIGLQIDPSNGNGSNFFGGNIEGALTGIVLNGGGNSFFGMRFENNPTDVAFGPFATGNHFFGCVGLTNVTGGESVGYNHNGFWGCIQGDVSTPFPNKIHGPTTFEAWAAADIPLNVLGRAGQTGNLEQVTNSALTVLRSLSSLGDEMIYGKWACNALPPQAKFASGGAAPAGGVGTAAGGWDTAAHRDAAITLLNNIRTALVNNGIMS